MTKLRCPRCWRDSFSDQWLADAADIQIGEDVVTVPLMCCPECQRWSLERHVDIVDETRASTERND